MGSNDRNGVGFAQPTTTEERTDIAAKCSSALKMTIPLLVDGIDDAVGRAYSGMPDRLYLLDKKGRVAYKGGRGPFGFKAPELEQSIAMLLLDQTDTKVGQFDPWKLLPKASVGAGSELPNWAMQLVSVMPKTTAAMLEIDHIQRLKSPLDPILRGKMRWLAAKTNGSAYALAHARADLKRAGMSEAKLDQLSDDPKTWSKAEKIALTFARKLTREAYKVLDEEVAELRRVYGDANVVAMVQLLAYANFQDRLLIALGVPLESEVKPPVAVSFPKPFASAAVPPSRALPVTAIATEPARVDDSEWKRLDFSQLQKQMEGQRAREPRIPVPPFSAVRKYMPPTFPKDKELKIKWSLVCLGYQPELASAWTQCTRSFGEESQQDRVFEESLFWIVTRSLQCFY